MPPSCAQAPKATTTLALRRSSSTISSCSEVRIAPLMNATASSTVGACASTSVYLEVHAPPARRRCRRPRRRRGCPRRGRRRPPRSRRTRRTSRRRPSACVMTSPARPARRLRSEPPRPCRRGTACQPQRSERADLLGHLVARRCCTLSPSAAEIHSRRTRSSSMPNLLEHPLAGAGSGAGPCSCPPGSGSRRGGSRRSARRRRPRANASARTAGRRGPSTSAGSTRTLGAYFIRDDAGQVGRRVACTSCRRTRRSEARTVVAMAPRSSDIRQHPLDLGEDLLVGEQVLLRGARRAGGDAGAAALAQRLVDRRRLLRPRRTSMALYGHSGTQILQPEHSSSSM